MPICSLCGKLFFSDDGHHCMVTGRFREGARDDFLSSIDWRTGEEKYVSVEYKPLIDERIDCPMCNGSGKNGKTLCITCHGVGKVDPIKSLLYKNK